VVICDCWASSSTRWTSVLRFSIPEAAIDPDHDANTFSFYYPSRLDIALGGGGRFDCEDLRAGCSGLTDDHGYAGEYSYVAIARSPDG
jgi:hypothetical protein